MGQEIVKHPKTPEGWAINLSALLNTFHAAHGTNRFPINVEEIAIEYSRQVFPDAPITLVQGMNLSKSFEGALIPNPNAENEWGIFYNENISYPGRRNFTLAHELGHYLLHRHLNPEGLRCTHKNMLDWKSEYAQTEAQANTFASYLLMPLDDFREQIKGEKPSIDLMAHLADRYDVSLTAVILKWLGICNKRAMIVVGIDGYIDWAWSSQQLLYSKIYYKAKQETTALPEQSLAAKADPLIDNRVGILHPPGIWKGNEEVHEMTILGKNGDMTISLLLYPDDAPNRWEKDEEEVEDTYDRFMAMS